ncbi:hypothetical protein CDD81_6680 [Ophiocordyceps australis]|uniref:Uncharacterized protein n=1 Tax=Ophiocordyceps australis TaxID=1399860 RepID=A0A2C5XHG8_9HYPO|nr:hypothetical protein CDD81_6680 [Ophiocordyceps australis]
MGQFVIQAPLLSILVLLHAVKPIQAEPSQAACRDFSTFGHPVNLYAQSDTQDNSTSQDPPYWAWIAVGVFLDQDDQVLWSTEVFAAHLDIQFESEGETSEEGASDSSSGIDWPWAHFLKQWILYTLNQLIAKSLASPRNLHRHRSQLDFQHLPASITSILRPFGTQSTKARYQAIGKHRLITSLVAGCILGILWDRILFHIASVS